MAPRTDQGFAVVDLETSGLRVGVDAIVEMAVVQLDGHLNIESAWSSLVAPAARSIGSVHGIDVRSAACAPTFSALVDLVAGHLEGRMFVAHHAAFDRAFLDVAFRREHRRLIGGSVCTRVLAARAGLPGKLSRLCAALGVPVEPRHRALPDAIATAHVLRRLHDGVGDPLSVRPIEVWNVR